MRTVPPTTEPTCDRDSYPYRLGELQAHAARLVEAIDESGVQLDPAGRFALDQVRELAR